jgi:hypothetical protein
VLSGDWAGESFCHSLIEPAWTPRRRCPPLPFRGPLEICRSSLACSMIVSRFCSSRSADKFETKLRAEVRFEYRSRSGSRSNCDLLDTHGTVLIGRVWRVSNSIESLAQIADQVRHIFNADRVPHKSVAITRSAPIRR